MRPVLVVGAGTMGRGIAQVALAAGHDVVLCDTNEEQLRSAVEEVVSRLARKDGAAAETAWERLTTAAGIDAAPSLVDPLVIEAVVERIDVKTALLGSALERYGAGSILATNTSSLSITEIAAGILAADRVIGMHFFNPVPVMRLVEVVSGLETDPAVADEVAAIARDWGKQVALVRSAPGFIVNRVARAFYGEALRLVEEGATTPECVDELLRSCGGFRMGPFELMDLIGVEVNNTVTRTVWSSYNFEPRFAPSLLQAELVAAGRLGRKSGHGFYPYADGAVAPRPVALETSTHVVPGTSLRGTEGQLQPIAAKAGIPVLDEAAADAGIEIGNGLGRVRITRGLTAAEESRLLGRPVVVVDRAVEPSTATSRAIAGADETLLEATAALLAAGGIAAYRVDDTPGLVVARILCMIANEACETVQQGVATTEDIDSAMVLATNYPTGPFAWLDSWGADQVRDVLDNLWSTYRDPRYRCSRRLRVMAATVTL
jgi:3-hydroxybutyryl-CoA dehydrogenase